MKYSLPDSSTDLLIKDGRQLMRSLSVYEVLRRFGHILRLTPFRYEDFTGALLSTEQSPLFAEIHTQLLKTLLREDKIQQTWLGPQDIRDSINIYLYSADHLCWPAALRVYLTADPYTNAELLEALKPEGIKSYPFNVGLSVRLDVLEELCEKFLLSVLAREDIVNGNQQASKQDTVCRLCSKANGEFIYCNSCPAIFHPECTSQSSANSLEKDELYLCALCKANHVIGVSDCVSADEKNGNLKRHEPIGIDMAGNTYWFIARRLFVVDELEEDIRYYSTPEQFDLLMESLREIKNEKTLYVNLLEQREEIERQMKITEELYRSKKDKSAENGILREHLGENDDHKTYINHYWSALATSGKNQHPDRDVIRTLSNKFSLYSITTFKWNGNIDGDMSILISTIKSTILRLESSIPQTFIHHCWPAQKQSWIKLVNNSQKPAELTRLLSLLESGIKPVLFRSFWQEGVGFTRLLRSTNLEREELKKTDKQARGFERRECVSQDFEIAYRMGTIVKFSSKLKPVKHQVWKQKGEEYRLTGLNGWYWRSQTHLSRLRTNPKILRIEPYGYSSSTTHHPFFEDASNEIIQKSDVIDVAENISCNEYRRYLYPKKPTLEPHRQKRIAKLEALLEAKQVELKRSMVLQQNQHFCEKNTTNIGTNIPAPKISEGGQLVGNQISSKQETPLLNISINGSPSLQTGDSKPNIMFNANRFSPTGGTKLNYIASTVTSLGSNNLSKKCVFAQPKLPPNHDFQTKRGKIRSLLVLPSLELHRMARSGGLRETKSFSYSAKPSQQVWPYGITPRPTFRTCWSYRNSIVDSFQDAALQVKVMHASIRWEDLQVKPPLSGQNVITTDDSIITIELLKKRDKLPYLTHSEYLIRKVTKPIEQPTKYRKVGTKKSTPSARIGLRARRSIEEDDNKGPTTEETWVSEDQLELWELRQFDEKIERHNQLMRERAMREEAERRRKLEEERRRKADSERRRQRAEEETAKRARMYAKPAKDVTSNSSTPRPVNTINIPNNNPAKQQVGPRPQQTSPVVRYLRTEQGQIIRLPASYLERGTPLILRQVGPGGNQTNTYIIRPQVITSPTSNLTLRMNSPVPTINRPPEPKTNLIDEKKSGLQGANRDLIVSNVVQSISQGPSANSQPATIIPNETTSTPTATTTIALQTTTPAAVTTVATSTTAPSLPITTISGAATAMSTTVPKSEDASGDSSHISSVK